MALPRFVVLKSNYNSKYLRYINEDVQVHGFLQFSGEEVVSPYVKYEVEMAKNGKGLVHIRCCYNNKYWVRWSSSHWWIVAGADEPDEDQSKWSCTLFEPVYADDAKTIVRFRHVQLGHNACLWRAAPPHESCLFAGSAQPDKDLCDVYTIIDWESLLILPKHIAFKGDNGNYLSARWIEGYRYLQFASSDIGDPTVGNEMTPPATTPIHCFWPIKVDNNIVALRNLGNNNFCKRLTTEGKTSCLNAAVSSISREARLEVCELVISRNIYNVNFRLMDARIYNQNVLTMATGNAINRSQEPNTIDMKLSYTDTRSSTWNANISLKLGVKTSVQTGIPLIAEGKVEISAEFSGAYQWGETQSSTTVMETVYKVTVPPMTMVKVSLLATKGSCDVPFSYSQRDTLINGQQTTHHMDDGVYTGMNCFNFKYETKQEKL
ncbi:hypothetical protein Acr_09g0008850 [Actinidia rufa]|uniref:Agglutinin domain-containing protein n=1 Tax=Actinidia rufa TaxID=165716 RepID=A0A7J0F8B5_9ERIC|nr:hypothetical protein Acr_09g0008850 [Actinidia rufa]